MCGIVGLLALGEQSHVSAVVRARDILAHRGPDDAGLWSARSQDGRACITLGHRRLSILDVSDRSSQPLLLTEDGRVRPAGKETSADARLALIFNGEIYNYVELRSELMARGYNFLTTGDAEVLLLAYAEWGENCLPRLNGMFSLAIWDRDRGHLFCARDRFGEKPFHYVLDERRRFFAFASEIKGLITMGASRARLDERAVYRYFRFGEQAGTEQTIWDQVLRLPRAHAVIISLGDTLVIRKWRYWTLPPRATSVAEADTVEQFRGLFADSVRLRLRSDVAVGTSLSGGLDSSSVVCQIKELGAAEGQLAFTARMDEPSLDESRYARLVVQETGIVGREITPSLESFLECLDRLFYHQEEPFPTTSIFASFLVQRLARDQGVTVLLDGQGADEYLAGYSHYPSAVLVDLARRGRIGAWWRERLALAARAGTDPVPPKAALRHWLHARRYGAQRAPKSPAFDVSFLRDDLHRTYLTEQPLSVELGDGLLDTVLRTDLLDGHLQELLRYADRNSMAFGRETRLPFLDHRLVELVMALPTAFVYRDGESKWILRRAMRGLVPNEILDRKDKIGFATPWKSWLQASRGFVLEERLRDAERELSSIAQPGEATISSPAALGLMGIASTLVQFRCLSAPQQLCDA